MVSRAAPETPRRRVAPLVAAAAVLLLLGGGVAFWLLQDSTANSSATSTLAPVAQKASPSTPATPAVQPAAQKPGPTPSATLNAIAAAPGQAIAKAKAAVEMRRDIEQERVDTLAEGQEPSGQRALGTPPPSALNTSKTAKPAAAPSVPVTSTTEVAPGVKATTVTSEVIGHASASFQAWVASARINGVFGGKPARALINGRTVRAGQSVDDALGIVFESVDPDAKTITFRDRSGATVSRRY